jgi:hypothetical protein
MDAIGRYHAGYTPHLFIESTKKSMEKDES